MLTVKQHEKLIDKIKALSEIELDDLLKEIVEHLQKNKLNHLLLAASGVDDIENEMEELRDAATSLEKERDDLQEIVNKIRQIL